MMGDVTSLDNFADVLHLAVGPFAPGPSATGLFAPGLFAPGLFQVAYEFVSL